MIPLLWSLLALFVLRVAGQALVAFYGVTWLPPMERWYSGLMPYRYLLPSQIALVVLMSKICSDFTRRHGFFVRPRRFFAVHWLWFGWIYLAVMLIRLPAQLLFAPSAPLIPIFFHWVLAAFVIAVGLWHRRHV
ncbi:MAG TPA: hypothetical protein VJT77_03815 [Burkholderiales bacterium]|nr:hypothetical protein [Burkholderiales bacterium]